MIILGDLSGIQNYVFDVAEEGGGQAQRLRARSFFVQLLAETAALRVLRVLEWPLNSGYFVLSGAGKFVLRGPDSPAIQQRLTDEQQAINEWLLRETRAELRLTLAWNESPESETTAYASAQRSMQRSKGRPWAPVSSGNWDGSRLLLAPLDTPCDLCHHATADDSETDRDSGQVRRVCRICSANRELGQGLPRARYLILRDRPRPADFEVLGLGVTVTDEQKVEVGQDVVAVANLRQPDERPSWCSPQYFMERRLMAHVPTDEHGRPVWFTELAGRARGDHLLGVLKADVDFLGVRFQQLLNSGGLDAMADLSEKLDAFFAGRLRQELAAGSDDRWRSIYTIFAGGDDLVMVGPWDVMLDFARQMREWFTENFDGEGLTLSAGLALIKPKRPIKFAVAEAERLLEEAKTGTKDQLAAFGQSWNWHEHDNITKTARQLVAWVNCGDMQRGWLQTLLELAVVRHGALPDPLATARLAYHVSRNYRPRTDAREWALGLVRRFDNVQENDVRYLPTIVRYALAATRACGEEK
jgi:CRISPR-associated protein Csm1